MAKKATATPPQGLRIRKRADKSGGTERPMSVTGEILPWPLAGIEIVGDPPDLAMFPTGTTLESSFVRRGQAEGWLELEGLKVVYRPAGPPGQPELGGLPDRLPHEFHHADAIVIHTVDGDVRYRVTHQPDKYAEHGDDDTEVSPDMYDSGATRVDWFYVGELVKE